MSPSTSPHRLRKHPDYQRVYGSARKQWARQIAWFLAAREPGSVAAQRSETAGPRIGLTVPKALGKAHERNRIKRRLRVLVRQNLALLQGLPVDLVLHPKRSVLEAEFAVLKREICEIFTAARKRSLPALASLPLPESARKPQQRPSVADEASLS